MRRSSCEIVAAQLPSAPPVNLKHTVPLRSQVHVRKDTVKVSPPLRDAVRLRASLILHARG
jgi:hypothetical protein